MATDKPKTPPGIRNFKAMLEQVAAVPKELVYKRVAKLAKANKRKSRKK